jgi:hypothetical protein
MTGFTTNELLYPLTKGEASGHPFRGNQYERGETGAAEEKTTRPPIGKFQLTPKEVKSIAKELVKNIKSIGDDKANDIAAVSIAKALGYDKPATIGEGKGEPDFYRGCSIAGAKSLTQPLEHYGMSGGTLNGNGVYLGNKETATVYKDYANTDNEKGTLVSAWIDPNAQIANPDTEKEDNQFTEYNRFLSEDMGSVKLTGNERDALDSFIEYGSNLSLLTGYQAYMAPFCLVVFDRSIMKVKY